MALFPPPRITSLYDAQLPSTLGLTKVTVKGDLGDKRRLVITWPRQQAAVRYILYVSPSPMFKNKYKEVPRTETTTTFQSPIIVPEGLIWYVWVAYINPQGAEVLVQTEPGYYLADSAFQNDPIDKTIARDITRDGDELYRIEEMRRRHLFILQNDGEDFLLHLRRWSGQKCICLTQEPGKEGRMVPISTSDYNDMGKDFDPAEASEMEQEEEKDPGYHGERLCPFCFGTSIVGGYLPSIRVKVRYGNLPKRTITYQEQGLFFGQSVNSWTIWHPQMKDYDLLVRIQTGERFLVKDIGNSSMRGITLHQEMNLTLQERPSPIYEVTNERIFEAMEKESAFNIASWNWAVWQ